MPFIKFTDFDAKLSPLTGDFLVGYANDSASNEYKASIKDIWNLYTDYQSLSYDEINENLYISKGNNVSLSGISAKEGLSVYTNVLGNSSLWDGIIPIKNINSNTYTLTLSDLNKLLLVNSENLTQIIVPNDDNIQNSSKFQILRYGSGGVLVTPDIGVNVRSANNYLYLTNIYSVATLVKLFSNNWELYGDINSDIDLTPTPTTTPTNTPTENATPTPTQTPTNTPTFTPTKTVTPTFTPTSSITPSVTPTQSVTPTSFTPTPTPTSETPTPTPTQTSTLTPTPTQTTTPTNTPTYTSTPTNTPTNTLTPTQTPTVTPPPNTNNIIVLSSGALYSNTTYYYNSPDLYETADPNVYIEYDSFSGRWLMWNLYLDNTEPAYCTQQYTVSKPWFGTWIYGTQQPYPPLPIVLEDLPPINAGSSTPNIRLTNNTILSGIYDWSNRLLGTFYYVRSDNAYVIVNPTSTGLGYWSIFDMSDIAEPYAKREDATDDNYLPRNAWSLNNNTPLSGLLISVYP